MYLLQVLDARRYQMSPNQSLSFSYDPLCIVKGQGTYIYTEDNRRYLFDRKPYFTLLYLLSLIGLEDQVTADGPN